MSTNIMDIKALTGKVKRKYWLFSTGFVVFGLSTAAAIGVYNVALGAAVLMAELTYFCYVNIITVGAMRDRLHLAEQYTKRLEALPAEKTDDEASIKRGQYL